MQDGKSSRSVSWRKLGRKGDVLHEEEERTMFVDDHLEVAEHEGVNTREAVEATVKHMVRPIFRAQAGWEVGWDGIRRR